MNPQSSVIFELYKYMNDKGVIVSYLGDFTHDVVTSLLSSIKKIINDSDMAFQNKKRFYAVVAECLDNVSRHNHQFEDAALKQEHNKTFLNISETKENFSIQTGNYVHETDFKLLSSKLDKVNSMEKEELKSYYREKLSQSPPTGGGLGIIDISLRTGCKMAYEFKPVTENVYFFVLQTTIKK